MATTHPLLAPYVPTENDPFDSVKAAHLLNRAAWGGTDAEVAKVAAMGPRKAVEWLMDFPDAPVEEQGPGEGPDLSSIVGYPASFRDIAASQVGKTADEKKEIQMKLQAANHEANNAIVAWWLNRMVDGPYPMQEKLAFFWHGHFTSSAKDERAAILLWKQNELLRKNAAGNFEGFVRQISRDPAMLDYLNNNDNRKQHPNENYARELMELFTLGIGNYTETDIKESARAFTGWGHDGENFVYRPAQHDEGIKHFFGQSGNFDGDSIITMILKKPACSQFIAGELFKYLANDEPDQSLVTALGQTFVAEKYEIRPLLRTILNSKAFFSPQSMGVHIKSPVQLVIGTARMLGLKLPQYQAVASALTQMGQLPLMPPNVRGWPGGQTWINTSTLFIRYNTAIWLAGGDAPALNIVTRKGQTGREIPARRAGGSGAFRPDDPGSAAQVVDAWVSHLIQRPIAPDKRNILLEAVGSNPDSPDSQRKLVQLIVSMPEYQLC